ncbi:MAG: hypothetical protein JXR58_08230 [Bacteroidales bacterium]|nr:hypothetical protein [Bacteroidales bacterium]
MQILNSTFQNCIYGLKSYDKRVNLTNCTFTNNDYGWYAESMTFNSNVESSIFTYNDYGIININSATSDITIYNCNIDYNYQEGVIAIGGFLNTIYCGSIKENGNNGIFLASGAKLDASSYYLTPNAGKVNMSGNIYSIFCNNSGIIYLRNGNNTLTPSSTSGMAVYGTTTMSSRRSHDCTNNKWSTTFVSPVFGTHYQLYSTLYAPPNNVNLTDNSPANQSCFIPKSGEYMSDDSGLLSNDAFSFLGSSHINVNQGHFSNTPLNLAYLNAFGSSGFGTASENIELSIEKFHDILDYTIIHYGYKEEIQYLANAYMNAGFGRLLSKNTSTDISSLNMLLNIQERIIDFAAQNDSVLLFNTRLSKSNIYTSANMYNEALEILYQMSFQELDSSALELVNRWICLNEIEQMAFNGEIEPGDEEELLANCSAGAKSLAKSNSFQGNSNSKLLISSHSNPAKLSVEPNPLRLVSEICVEIPYEYQNARLLIYTAAGILISAEEINGKQYKLPIKHIDYTPGLYYVVLEINGTTAKTERFVVVE